MMKHPPEHWTEWLCILFFTITGAAGLGLQSLPIWIGSLIAFLLILPYTIDRSETVKKNYIDHGACISVRPGKGPRPPTPQRKCYVTGTFDKVKCNSCRAYEGCLFDREEELATITHKASMVIMDDENLVEKYKLCSKKEAPP